MKVNKIGILSLLFSFTAILGSVLFQYTNIFYDGGLLPCKFCVYIRYVFVAIFILSILNIFLKKITLITGIFWVVAFFLAFYMSFIQRFPQFEACGINNEEKVEMISYEDMFETFSSSKEIVVKDLSGKDYGYFEVAKTSCSKLNWKLVWFSISDLLVFYISFYFFILFFFFRNK